MSDAMGAYIEQRWDEEVIPRLCDYIRIPNLSPAFDPAWEANGHMAAAADLLYSWCAEARIAGLTRELVTLPGRTPLLFVEVLGTGADASTVLLYGHYDKQPEFTGWLPGLGPWEPVQRDGRLYGRGGADDGYALFSILTALEALQREGLPHSRCVIIIEGCEESGSFDLPPYIDHLADRIGTPELVICLDAECGNYDQFWVTTSLRGMMPGTLTVEVLTEGVHSGMGGGIVPSSFRLLRGIIERLEDARSGEMADLLQVQIPQSARDQAQHTAAVLGDEVFQRFSWVAGAPAGLSVVDALIANTWRPTLATVGLSGAPEVAEAGNTLRPATSARLVLRLPPTLDAAAVAPQVKALLEADPPTGSKVTFDLDVSQSGWSAPELSVGLEQAITDASTAVYGKAAMYMGCGGTIPFMHMLGARFPAVQFLVTGVLGPGSNAHGPNEFLHLGMATRVTECIARVLTTTAQRRSG